MLELSSAKKNKVNLADYNYQEDIANRILMSDFSEIDITILQEILFSPLKVPLKKLLRQFQFTESDFLLSLKKLSKTGLLEIQDDTIVVNKEKRKYFEFQIPRFDPDFKPDMHFLQSLLKKVPIQVLPIWYSIPRTSNNIFDSIVEKYLLTPSIYQRYLKELNFGDPVFHAITNDLFAASDCKLYSSDVIAKYNLKREHFEEILLLLEFHFIGYLCYEKVEDHWLEYISPFEEWREYLHFLKQTEAPPIVKEDSICKEEEFAFIKEMCAILMKIKEKSQAIEKTHAVEKLCLIHLAECKNKKWTITEEGQKWLEMGLEDKALHLYRHPQNRLLNQQALDRCVREAEKAIKRALHGRWVFFEDFVKGVLVPLSEASVCSLKKCGKQWKYVLPRYSDEEKRTFKTTIFQWLNETGMVVIGKCSDRDCFAVTPFGRFFFEE